MSDSTTHPRPLLRFGVDEINRAAVTWGCNCGPAALAACMGLDLDEVRPNLGRFEQLGYMSREMMFESVVKLGFRCREDLVADQDGVDRYPGHGLSLMQFGGPWIEGPKANPKWAKTNTHWIACKIVGIHTWIFDVNCFGWTSFQRWSEGLVPALIKANKLRDGTHWLINSWEVRRIERRPSNRRRQS